jgi:hypothetical protein
MPAHILRLTILFGLTAQCFLHAVPGAYSADPLLIDVVGIFGVLLVAFCVGIFEGLAVKLQWRKNADFIAYSLTMSLLACFVAVGRGIVK